MSLFSRACLIVPLTLTMGGCWSNIHEDEGPISKYFQRKDGVTLSAGNAKQVNEVTHIGEPWPPYAGDRNIPGNGERMAGAAERYRDVSKLPKAPKAIAPATSGEVSIISNTGQ